MRGGCIACVGMLPRCATLCMRATPKSRFPWRSIMSVPHLRNSLSVVGLFSLLAACASSVGPGEMRDAATDGTDRSDGGDCILYNGTRCSRGATCPARDGCNQCTCSADGQLACTLLPCVPRRCRSAAECGRNEVCVFEQGCVRDGENTGTCQQQSPCFEPMEYCGCDGRSFLECSPTRPWRHVGACGRDE